jgi:F-type H+-transporting ATPase subunit c
MKEPLKMSKKLPAAFAAVLATLVPTLAFAQTAAASNDFDAKGMAYLGAGIAIAIAVLGGALGQGRAAAAALEGISRNPSAANRIQTPMILGLALIESLVLFGVFIAYTLAGK